MSEVVVEKLPSTPVTFRCSNCNELTTLVTKYAESHDERVHFHELCRACESNARTRGGETWNGRAWVEGFITEPNAILTFPDHTTREEVEDIRGFIKQYGLDAFRNRSTLKKRSLADRILGR